MQGMLAPIASAAPGLAMLAAFACLIGGGYVVARRPRDRLKGWLMIVMAVVLIANVAIWTV